MPLHLVSGKFSLPMSSDLFVASAIQNDAALVFCCFLTLWFISKDFGFFQHFHILDTKSVFWKKGYNSMKMEHHISLVLLVLLVLLYLNWKKAESWSLSLRKIFHISKSLWLRQTDINLTVVHAQCVTGCYKVPSKCPCASPNITAIYCLIEGLEHNLLDFISYGP